MYDSRMNSCSSGSSISNPQSINMISGLSRSAAHLRRHGFCTSSLPVTVTAYRRLHVQHRATRTAPSSVRNSPCQLPRNGVQIPNHDMGPSRIPSRSRGGHGLCEPRRGDGDTARTTRWRGWKSLSSIFEGLGCSRGAP